MHRAICCANPEQSEIIRIMQKGAVDEYKQKVLDDIKNRLAPYQREKDKNSQGYAIKQELEDLLMSLGFDKDDKKAKELD